MSRFPVIDADGHVFEPFSLWQERLEPCYREHAFRRSVDDSGAERILICGFPADIGYSVGSLCTPGAISSGGRLDVDINEVDRAIEDPVRRVELMDEQGIAVSVLFPTMCLGLDDLPDPELRLALARTYNDWIAEFCAHDPCRLRWAAVVPLEDVEGAIAEAERTLAAGASTLMLCPVPTADGRTLGDPSRDPLWARLAEAGRPAVVHAANPDTPRLGLHGVWLNRIQWQMGVPFLLQLAVLHIIDGGVLERHPRLRVGFFEGDVGWLPHWLGRLDETYQKMALLSRRPERSALEQFRAQCVISGEPADRGLAHTAELIGAERVLWASDWPHQDGAWPDPLRLLLRRKDLSDHQKRQIYSEGAAYFFGIDRLAEELGPGWDLNAPLESVGSIGGGPIQGSLGASSSTPPSV